MKSSGLAVLGLALATATSAAAQTTVTREVADMPVETTIVRSPTSTTITRRVLAADEVAVPAPEVVQRSVIREPRRSAQRNRASTRVVTTRPARAPVYAMATAEPVVLDRAQRDVVYRRIVEQRMPAQRGLLAPIGSMFPVVTSAPAVTYTQPVRTTYVVGSRLPSGINLIELPESVIAEVPSISPYAYAMVDGRVLLVDPQTSLIVADLTE